MTEGARREVLVALGSSLGDRERELDAARAHLERFGVLVDCSAVHETEPWGASKRPYLNQVVVLETSRTPWALHEANKGFERTRGRDPARPIGSSREVDVDLLLVRGLWMRSARLSLPHPRLWRRRFLHDVVETLATIEAWRDELRAAGLWS